jgi:hypothetical protein
MQNMRAIPRRLLVGVATLPLACGGDHGSLGGHASETGGGGESGSASDGDDGCADLFDDGEFSCPPDSWCGFAAEHPNRVVGWAVEFRQDLGGTGEPKDSISDFERKVMCIEAYLDSLGIEHRPDNLESIEHGTFGAVASYAQIEPLCRASMISRCSPAPELGGCEAHGEDECEVTPWCEPLRGQRIEPGASCYVADVFGVCFPVGLSCGDNVQSAKGPDGACWLFLDSGFVGCVEEQPDWEIEPPDCPDVAEWESIPECG